MTVVLCSLTNIASRSLVAPDKVLWKRWEGREALQATFQQQLCTNGMGVWEATPGLGRQFSNAVNVCSQYMTPIYFFWIPWPLSDQIHRWNAAGWGGGAAARLYQGSCCARVEHTALPQGKCLRTVMRRRVFLLAEKVIWSWVLFYCTISHFPWK